MNADSSERGDEVFTEQVLAIERHLKRVSAKLPKTQDEFLANTDASDAVILHFWQAV